MRALLLSLSLLAGCSFKPSFDNVACGPAGECPPGFECCNGTTCLRDCNAADLGTQTDAGDGGPDGTCEDGDQDGVCDDVDNCPDVANPGQGDCDTNKIGDACDPVYEAQCYGLRATLSSGGGITEGTTDRLTGGLGESSHSISSGPGFRLRGGLLPRAPRGP